MRFEWDEEKNQSNIRKHGFDFADAEQVFMHPMIVGLDDRENYGEDRWIGIGLQKTTVVVIVFAERDNEAIRVISLRKALSYERSRYAQILKDQLETD